MSPSAYEWVRNYQGLIPLRRSCSKPCWMSDGAWTEWKNYSAPRYNYVAWLPESRPHCVFKSRTLGTLSLFVSAIAQQEMSIQARKNVRRLSMSKSLTCADLNVALTPRPGFATKQWSPFGYGSGDWVMSDKTFSPFSGHFNGKPPLKGERGLPWSHPNANPLRDMYDLMRRRRNDP